MMKIYDLVIIGSGPAGMSAAIYAQRAMLDFVVIEKEYMPGGQVVQTYEVDNYPGIPKTNGMDLGLIFRTRQRAWSREYRWRGKRNQRRR